MYVVKLELFIPELHCEEVDSYIVRVQVEVEAETVLPVDRSEALGWFIVITGQEAVTVTVLLLAVALLVLVAESLTYQVFSLKVEDQPALAV